MLVFLLLTVPLLTKQEQRPIYSFEVTGDYIYDVAWSPIHPSVFADVDGNGRLNLWNLNNDTELPSATVQVDGPAALNRVSWTSSGQHVIAGDDMGKIWVYDVGEVSVNYKWKCLNPCVVRGEPAYDVLFL